MNSQELHEYCRRLIHGVGGFHDLEKYELYMPEDRDVAIVEFVVRALANPDCEGSLDILLVISERIESSAKEGVAEAWIKEHRQ